MSAAPEVSPRDNAATEHLIRLSDGYLVTGALAAAAELRVADVLSDGPRSVPDIAAAVGARPEPLRRILRMLAAEAVLEELPEDRFALTASGQLLRTGIQGSLHAETVARGAIYTRAAASIVHAVRDGAVPFEREYGRPLFEHLSALPESLAAFQTSMTHRAVREAECVVAAYDFADFARVVDVGGGNAALLTAVLTATPGLRGVLFDLPPVVADAVVPESVEVVGGSFFDGVPTGGDVYLLSRVLHDWDDEATVAILSRVREAMSGGAVLLIVDCVLPERAVDGPAVVRMDMSMLNLTKGRERTGQEFAALLHAAGLTLARIVPTESPAGVAIIEATLVSA